MKRLGIDPITGQSITEPSRALVRAALCMAMSVVAVPATTLGATPAPRLDPFLSGLETQCVMSPPFESFLNALRQTDGAAFRLTPTAAKAQLDPTTRSAIGEMRITEETNDYQLIAVDVTGTWREVPVERIEFWLGKGSGIFGTAVIFAPPSTGASQVFEQRIKRSAHAMATDPTNDSEAMTGFEVIEGRARLWCDWST